MSHSSRSFASAVLASPEWRWPLDLESYDRSPDLTPGEQAALARRSRFPSRLGYWTPLFYQELGRLAEPVRDALDYIHSKGHARTAVQHVITEELLRHKRAFWAWNSEEWRQILGHSRDECLQRKHIIGHSRNALMGVAYLLCRQLDIGSLGRFERVTLAFRLFEQDRVDAAVDRVLSILTPWGYSRLARDGMRMVICEVFLHNRNPRLEDISYELLDSMRHEDQSHRTRGCILRLSRALIGLGILDRELGLWGVSRGDADLHPRASDHDAHPEPAPAIAPKWTAFVKRWAETCTLSPGLRDGCRGKLLMLGRWITATHPEAASPDLWTREIAAESVAMICQKRVGDWVGPDSLRRTKEIGKPLTASTRLGYFHALAVFFRDCQEWEWIPRRFDAGRAFSYPPHLRRLLRTNPRVISDDVWAKLLWAGLNITQEDMSIAFGGRHYYPLAMIRALTVVWLFAGLRQSEIRRLRVGCIRFNSPTTTGRGDQMLEEVCLLEVPVNKTTSDYTKPVDRVVGEAVLAWEKERPSQPAGLDEKTNEMVHFLFSYRCARFSDHYLNDTLIPSLCQKAGIPTQDARGRITSHRARSTIATQLFNAREPLSLFELQEWLGHRTPNSTQHYARINPTKLARSYAEADYFRRNLRTIDVLIDQDVVRKGAAAGEPWRFYDLGHGYCTYDFFDQCPHRMACARCSFYRPKGSAAALFLEGKQGLLRLKQEIPLTEGENAAVDDGVNAFEKLLSQLADVPTPAGPTPRQLEAGLVQLESTPGGSHGN